MKRLRIILNILLFSLIISAKIHGSNCYIFSRAPYINPPSSIHQNSPHQQFVKDICAHRRLPHTASPISSLLTNPKACAQWKKDQYIQAISYLCQGDVTESALIYYVHQWKFYEYQGFWDFLHTLPDYEKHIRFIHELITANDFIKKQLSHNALKRIEQEYTPIREREQRAERSAAARQWQHAREQCIQNSFAVHHEQLK